MHTIKYNRSHYILKEKLNKYFLQLMKRILKKIILDKCISRIRNVYVIHKIIKKGY